MSRVIYLQRYIPIYICTYPIVQNAGKGKLGRIDHFRVSARKMLANIRTSSQLSGSGIWLDKIMANDVPLPNSPKSSLASVLHYTVHIRICTNVHNYTTVIKTSLKHYLGKK